MYRNDYLNRIEAFLLEILRKKRPKIQKDNFFDLSNYLPDAGHFMKADVNSKSPLKPPTITARDQY